MPVTYPASPYIPVPDALAELRPFYPKAHAGRVYLFLGDGQRIACRPTFRDVRWDAVCVAIHRAVMRREVPALVVKIPMIPGDNWRRFVRQ